MKQIKTFERFIGDIWINDDYIGGGGGGISGGYSPDSFSKEQIKKLENKGFKIFGDDTPIEARKEIGDFNIVIRFSNAFYMDYPKYFLKIKNKNKVVFKKSYTYPKYNDEIGSALKDIEEFLG